jgi:hypothetical protein
MFSSIRSALPVVGLWAFILVIAAWAAFAAFTWSEYRRCGAGTEGVNCSRVGP